MAYTFKDNLSKAVAKGIPSHVKVGAINLIVYPQRNVAANTLELTASYVARVFDTVTNKEHLAIVSYNPEIMEPSDNYPYRVRCGDKILAGVPRAGVTEDAQRQDMQKTCESLVAKLGLVKSSIAVLMEAWGKYKDPNVDSQGTCKFYTNWKKDHSWCDHTDAFMATLQVKIPDWADKLKAKYDEFTSIPVKPSIVSKYAFRVPIWLEGPQGTGKTTRGRLLAEQHGHELIEIGGHEDMEATELLGYYIQAVNPDGSSVYVWKDGPLSKAFRLAKTKKVVLLFDELLRVPTRHLSILLTALSPTSEGTYRLATNRAISVEEGVADIEVLQCPVQNLAVIATTNVGADYAVHMSDKALESRFIKEYVPTTVDGLKQILKDTCEAKKAPLNLVDKLISFFNTMTDAHAKGLVADVPSTRHLTRAILEASDKTLEKVSEVVLDQTLYWVARDSDGAPVPEQISAVETIAKKVFT